MSKTTSIDSKEDLQTHIDLVGREFATSSGARAIAASIGISEGIDDPDSLHDRCKELVGYETNQEGYVDSYALDKDGHLFVPEDGQPFFGYGISISSHEAYLALFEHFGTDWLDEALTEYALKQTLGMTRGDAAERAQAQVYSGKQSYVTAGVANYQRTLATLGEKQRRVSEGFFSSLKIIAPEGIKFVSA